MKKLSVIFACLMFSGCYNIVLEDEPGYQTIDGMWRVRIEMLKNTCDPEEQFKALKTDLFVTVQDWPEGGGYVADFFVEGLEWLDVEVGEEGNFSIENDYGILIDTFSGNIVPGRVDAVFGYLIEAVGAEDGCDRLLNMSGYQPLEHNTPPEGFEE